jgi:hypothetical protein
VNLSRAEHLPLGLRKTGRAAYIAFRRIFNPLLPIRPGCTKVHLFDIPMTWDWTRRRQVDDFVIRVCYPGIGDHLFYSHLPELIQTLGLAQKVWISAHSPMRTPEMKEIIWEANPHVQGFSSRRGWYNSGLRRIGSNFLDGLVMQFTGEGPRPASTLPKLYWPSSPAEKGGYWIWDFNRINNRHRMDVLAVARDLESRLVLGRDIFCYEGAFAWDLLRVSRPLADRRQAGSLRMVPAEPNLKNYFVRIRNADRFFGFYSGGAVVAAAYNTPCTTYCEFRDPATSFETAEYVLCPEKGAER